MKVSVLMSAYCGSHFIREQVDSIIHQTRVPDELVIINDCSSDDGKTESIIDEYVKRYPFVVKHNNLYNMGWAASFMNGINLISGEVVFFADQDDVWVENKIEKMMEVMQNKNINAVISGCINTDISLNPIQKYICNGKLSDDKYPFNSRFIYPKGVGAAMAIRREFLDKYHRFWNPSIGHDRFYQIMLVLFDKLFFLDMPLVKHRMHGNNATSYACFSSKKRVEGIDGNIQLINDLFSDVVAEQLKSEQIRVINQYLKYADNRKKMLEKKSFYRWLMMPVYGLRFYPTKKTWFGDLRCIMKREN